jgi:hypothetical protein
MFFEFSDFELHLSTAGHVFGALVLHILGMNQIRTSTRRLKVFLQSSPVISHPAYTVHLNNTFCTSSNSPYLVLGERSMPCKLSM